MDFDPFHISTIRIQRAPRKETIVKLLEELGRKNEEHVRMESQIINLSEYIVSKDHIIFDLEQKVKILQQSIDELAESASDNTEAKNKIEFYKKDMKRREQDAALITRERDMLNWKLIHEAMSTDAEGQAERKNLNVNNDKLSYNNVEVLNKLDGLSRKIDTIARRNADLSLELEKRSRFSEKLKSNFESAIQSRNKLCFEVNTLKKKLIDVKNSIKSTSATGSRHPIRARPAEKPSFLIKRSVPQQIVRPQSNASLTTKENSLVKISDRPTKLSLETVAETHQSDASFSHDVEKNIVRKIVHNLQSTFSTEPTSSSDTSSFVLGQQPENTSIPVRDTTDSFARKLAFENIRSILENKFSNDSPNQTDHTFNKPKSIQSISSLPTKDFKNHRL